MSVTNKGNVKDKKGPRRHHYIPEFYLANFTSTGKKDDFLWVLAQQQASQWKATPKNIAHKRDFYRIDVDDLEPTYIESGLSEFEGKTASVIERISESRSLPKGDDFLILMNFVALMAVRVPGFRDNMSKSFSDLNKKVMRLITAKPERWESEVSKLKKKGYKLEEDISYEQMKRFVDKDQYKVETDQNYLIGIMFELMDTILPPLIDRKWTMVVIEDNENKFICSDNPVTLDWIEPIDLGHPPGFGMPNSLVIFPISANIAILGCFEKHLDIKMTKKGIAVINSIIGRKSERFIYSAEKNFIWYMKNGEIGDTAKLLQVIKAESD
jgi:hypothetical protein